MRVKLLLRDLSWLLVFQIAILVSVYLGCIDFLTKVSLHMFANAILKVAVGFCTVFPMEKQAFVVFHWKPLLYFCPNL